MKKVSLLFIILALTTPQTQCASTQALRYLKLAGTAAWQGAKAGTQWTMKNPKKTIGTIGVGALAWDSYKNATSAIKKHSLNATKYKILLEENVSLQTHPAIELLRTICNEHGIPNLLAEVDTSIHPSAITMHSIRDGDRHFVVLTPSCFNQMIQGFIEPGPHLDFLKKWNPNSLELKHWISAFIHEIGHLKENHSRLGTIFKAVLPEKVSTHPRIMAVFYQYLERRADDYVIKTAYETSNPDLLDEFAEFFEVSSSLNLSESSLHPSSFERSQKARTAAVELRELMAAEKKSLFFLRSDGQMTPMQKIYCPSSNF